MGGYSLSRNSKHVRVYPICCTYEYMLFVYYSSPCAGEFLFSSTKPPRLMSTYLDSVSKAMLVIKYNEWFLTALFTTLNNVYGSMKRNIRCHKYGVKELKTSYYKTWQNKKLNGGFANNMAPQLSSST